MAERNPDDRRRERDKARMRLEGSPADISEVPGWTGRLMVWMRVVAHLVAIQLMMIAGTVLGLVIVGLGPATVAGAGLLRRIVDGDPSDALWGDFWRAYRAELPRAAIVTAPFMGVIALAWYELLVLLAYGGDMVTTILSGAVIALGAYAVACLGYAPHVLRRYEDPAVRTLRFVAVAPLLSPLTALGCAITVIALTVIGIKFIPVMLLIGLSVPLLLTGLIVDRWLDKVDARGAVA
ncbi:YesL family protein [Demequina subtropica]|uniref:YesL family protein n=1 Tax=Demequina subtropica TaxID=1638989 RepID=UPI000782CCE4|nr:DUF624 domain-containing protein [Demequina subtropica]